MRGVTVKHDPAAMAIASERHAREQVCREVVVGFDDIDEPSEFGFFERGIVTLRQPAIAGCFGEIASRKHKNQLNHRRAQRLVRATRPVADA